MRTDLKVAVVLVLAGVIVVVAYFFGREKEKGYDLAPSKPPITDTRSPGANLNLPQGPVNPVKETADRGETEPKAPTRDLTAPEGVEPTATPKKPEYRFELGSPSTRPVASRPVKESSRRTREGHLKANQPVSIDMDATGDKPANETTGTPVEVKETIHVIKPGETLFQIAQKYYGRGDAWHKIVEANKGLKPQTLHPGAKLTIPAREETKTGKPEKAAKSEKTTKPGKPEKKVKSGPTSKPAATKPKGGKTYKVQPGDTFYTIAEEVLGSGSR